MKQLKRIKLNAIAKSRLAEREMNALRGGGQPGNCTCSCYWANNGGSSVIDNSDANIQIGADSPYGEAVVITRDWKSSYTGGGGNDGGSGEIIDIDEPEPPLGGNGWGW